MTITYNTALLRDAVNTLSISVRVTERGERVNERLEPDVGEIRGSDHTDN